MSADRLKQMKERSKLRRQLLAQQLGVKDENDFGDILGRKEEAKVIPAPVIGRNSSLTSPTTNEEFKLPGRFIVISFIFYFIIFYISL